MMVQLNTFVLISTEWVNSELGLPARRAFQEMLFPVFLRSHQNILLAQLVSIHEGFLLANFLSHNFLVISNHSGGLGLVNTNIILNSFVYENIQTDITQRYFRGRAAAVMSALGESFSC